MGGVSAGRLIRVTGKDGCTPSQDRHGDVVNPLGARFTLPIVLLWQQDTGTPIGSIPEATKSASGIRVRARLNKAVAKAAEAWALAQDGVLSMSIGFIPIKQTALPDGGYRYDEYEITEISVVSVPAQPDARISVGKSVAYIDERRQESERLPAYDPCEDIGEDFQRAVATLPASTRKQVSERHSLRTGRTWILRDVHGAEIATVAPPQEKQTQRTKAAPMSNGTQTFVTARELEKFAELLGRLVGRSVKPLHERIEALERENKALRSQVVRGGMRYKGFWRPGIYLEGDIVTEQGSAWICLRETREKPHHNATDWNLFVRKGRDA